MGLNYSSRRNIGDYPIVCDTCGRTCWYSQSKELIKEVGLGAARVCRECDDGIYWGSVPFKVEAEENIPVARPRPEDNNPTLLDQENIVDPAKLDFTKIMAYNTPDTDLTLLNPNYGGTQNGFNWENININWESLNFNWEDLGS